MGIPDNELVERFLEEERLPDSFRATLSDWYLPLVERLLAMLQATDAPLLAGINGAQGTGKSTLARFLTQALQRQQLRVANLSLDDFYLDGARRAGLARRVHPLLASRGVPGTHDLDLLRRIFQLVCNPGSTGALLLPRFDKSTDEPLPRSAWDAVSLPVDLVLLEGWFVGLAPQKEAQLSEPVNSLEAREDSAGTWRHYVNARLADYQWLFDRLDFLLMLRAPSFACVYRWRGLQEQKLAAVAGTRGNKVMDEAGLERFIQHFERLTRHCLAELPARADLVFQLDEQHRITHSSPPVS
jgi:D-glycerate 3-kinase